MVRLDKMDNKREEKIMFWICLFLFAMHLFLFGFMIGDMDKIIAGTSENQFKIYLAVCEIMILLMGSCVINFFIQITTKKEVKHKNEQKARKHK